MVSWRDLTGFIRRLCYLLNHWEELCDRCGSCCYSRYNGPDGDLYIDHDNPCPRLSEDGRCTVYNDRRRRESDCHRLTLRHILFDRAHPPWCGYRIYLLGQKAESIPNPPPEVASIANMRSVNDECNSVE